MAKVLVVEDSKAELDLIKLYLTKHNHQVICATNAKDGMELAAHEQPQVIVTDITMDGISGFEFCRLLKAYPDTEHIPVVACTGRDREMDRMWGQKQGIDVYITKPYTEEELIKAIESVLK